MTKNNAVIDTSPAKLFAEGHVASTINIPAGMVAQWAGWLVDYDQPLYLIADLGQLAEITRVLRKIGVDDIAGVFDAEAVAAANLRTQSYASASPAQLESRIASGDVSLVDVRARTEWNEGHIAQAQHVFLGRLPERASEFAGEKVVTQCLLGGRSAIAASILQAAGAEVTNMDGGITAWKEANLPITKDHAPSPA